MHTNHYPIPNLELVRDVLTPEHFAWAAGIINPRTGELRHSRPDLAKKIAVRDENYPPNHYYAHRYVYANDADRAKAYTAYLWRNVAFCASPNGRDQCMPIGSDFWLDEPHEQRAAMCRLLDAIVDVILLSIPAPEWYGIARWANLLGTGQGRTSSNQPDPIARYREVLHGE